MDQVATLTTGWEPDTPLDDSVLRQFVFAYADRVAWMAQATHGRVDRDAAACIADAGSAFGYDNDRGEPVATAGACTAGGIVEVDWVSTLPSHRSRGIGAAITAAAASTDPTRPAVLLASDDGRGIYRRLGFLDLVRLTIWEHQPAKPGESERRQTR
jgi:GNAT superfamily N-acetyltransferase